ncbi:MAG: hypothetical protein WCO65_01660 [bacterium]
MKLTTIQKFCAAFMFGLILFWVFLLLSGSKNTNFNYLFSALTNIIPLTGGIFIIIESKQWRGASDLIYKGLFFMGLGLLFWAFGGAIWSYYNFFLHMSVPYPSLADLGYAPSEFFYCIGAIFLSRGAGADLGIQNKYAKFFVAIMPILIFVFSYYLLITIGKSGVLITPHDYWIKTVLDILYPIGDFIGLCLSVIISGLYFNFLMKKYKFGIVLVLIGLVAMFFSDFLFSYTTTRATFFNGNFADLLSTFSLFLLTFGSMFFLEEKVETNNTSLPTLQ